MSHARQQLRDAVAAALTGLTTTGGNVYPSRVYPFDVLPCLAIYTGDESLNEEFDVMGTDQFRDLEVVVEARAKATANLDNTLDTICAEVEAAIAADDTIGGRVQCAQYQSTDIELNGESEKPTGVARITFLVTYRIDATDPEVLIS